MARSRSQASSAAFKPVHGGSLSDTLVVVWSIGIAAFGWLLWLLGYVANEVTTASAGSSLISMGILGVALRKVISRELLLKHLALTDELTGSANRRCFDECLKAEWHRACRSGTQLALLMIDVDHFKRFNDRFGHPAGDACLRQVAEAMRNATRPGDLACRVGGEEFAVLLPGCNERQARDVGERLRAKIAARGIRIDGHPEQRVTISIGAAALRPDRTLAPAGLIGIADAALYEAKSRGRNQVVCVTDTLDTAACVG